MTRINVLNRFTGAVQFTAEIECADDAPHSVKLGLAVRRAIKNKADMSEANLSGADLSGANLSEADLSWANLKRADLSRANLSRANLRIIGGRSDGYQFHMHRHPDGAIYLRAGCRYFTLEDARKHWIATSAGTPLGEESLALVDHAERMARIAGWLT